MLLLLPLLSRSYEMPPEEIKANRQTVASMFDHAYSSYMTHAFPHDELKPLTGSWSDSLIELGNVPNPKRDGYVGVAMTLIDSLDTLAVLGNHTAFAEAVRWLSGGGVSFDQDAVVSVFESTIRLLGGLLSAHVLAAGTMPGFAHMRVDDYDGALLRLAHDLGERLLPAFEAAPATTGLPYAFVHLQRGVVEQPVAEQCVAGIGSNLLEFALLSNLTDDDRFARASLRALRRLWERRSAHDLLGTTIDIATGRWLNPLASIGAGADSFYEYLAKGALLLDSAQLKGIFARAYAAVGEHLQQPDAHDKRRSHFEMADMHRPESNRRAAYGALQAFWPGLQVLAGEVDRAVPAHATFMAVWDMYGLMPEQYVILGDGGVSVGHVPYPLRPEVAESTLALFRATGDHAYLRFGARMLESINRQSRAPFGFASISSVVTGAREDHMPSFFLSETLKYLYLLFDDDNALHAQSRAGALLLSTEAHVLPILGAGGLRADIMDELVNARCSN